MRRKIIWWFKRNGWGHIFWAALEDALGMRKEWNGDCLWKPDVLFGQHMWKKPKNASPVKAHTFTHRDRRVQMWLENNQYKLAACKLVHSLSLSCFLREVFGSCAYIFRAVFGLSITKKLTTIAKWLKTIPSTHISPPLPSSILLFLGPLHIWKGSIYFLLFMFNFFFIYILYFS